MILCTREPDYNDDDEKSDKEGEENQERDTGEITINQVFWLLLPHFEFPPSYKSWIQ